MVASETCALDLVGAEPERELGRGELLVIDEDGVARRARPSPPAEGALCIFEFFYLARPDTRLEGVEVHAARVRMGERLAEEAPVEADLVLPIPDSGTPAAIGFSRATGIPFSEGLIKNRYVGRTFIQPDQELRQQGIRLKFNPLAEVAGKRVVIVDDSIVRGNTTRQIVAMLFDAGATEVHVRISSPPVIGPCFYGIDLADDERADRRRRARSTRCASRSARPRSPTSRSRASSAATAPPGLGALPRLPHRRLPDADPGGPAAREAAVRAGAGSSPPVDQDQHAVVGRARLDELRRYLSPVEPNSRLPWPSTTGNTIRLSWSTGRRRARWSRSRTRRHRPRRSPPR